MQFKKLMMVAVVGTFISSQAQALNWKELGHALGCTIAGKSRFDCPKSDHGKDVMWDKVWALKSASGSDLVNIANSKDAPSQVREAAKYELNRRNSLNLQIKPRNEVKSLTE